MNVTAPTTPLLIVTSAIAPLPDPVKVTVGTLEYVLTAAAGVYPTPGLTIVISLDPLIVAIPATPSKFADAPSFAACLIVTPGINPVAKSL